MQTRLETCTKNPKQSPASVLLTGSLCIPVIMDEVKRVKIVVTGTTYDFYMIKKGQIRISAFTFFRESELAMICQNLFLKGQIRISAFTFFRESELAMICQNLFLKSVYFQCLNEDFSKW